MQSKKTFFEDKTILITGGTGSIGSEVLKALVSLRAKKIIVFSRDEYKQHQLRYKYSKHDNISYVIGDVRDLEKVVSVSNGVDILFHCAALKHVPVSEEMPEEFIKTNIIGSLNIVKAAILNNISRVVSVGTDKAVNPSNVMGLTKAIQEKIIISHGGHIGNINHRFVNVRFGNVIGTHGSLFPIFYHQIVNGIPLTVTDPNMTRFFMSKAEAVDLIFWAAMNGEDGEIVIRKMKSVKIVSIIKSFLKVLGKKGDYPIHNIGTRVGEKIHEHLITEDELYRVKAKGDHYIITPYSVADLRENVLTTRGEKIPKMSHFSSHQEQNYMTQKELENCLKNFTANICNSLDFI